MAIAHIIVYFIEIKSIAKFKVILYKNASKCTPIKAECVI